MLPFFFLYRGMRSILVLVGGCLLAAPCAADVPMRGWMSWERFTCAEDCDRFPETCISERLILTTIDAIISEGFLEVGYNYVQIDDCWLAEHRSSTGDLQADPKRFPRGIKFIADYAHARGVKLGMYSDIGSATCCGLPSFNVSAVPDARADAQLQRDADLLVSWGMDSLKVDGCNADTRTMNVTYPKLGVALKNAAAKYGRPSPWYSCSWPFYVAQSVCGGHREASCMQLDLVAEHCQSARVYNDIADSWFSGSGQGVENIINEWMKEPSLAELRNSLPPGTTYYNDPDQLLIGNNGLSRTQAEVQMGMWVLFAAPLIMSTEIRNGSMSPDMKAILQNREVLELADDPLQLQATLCPSPGCSHKNVLYGGVTSVWNKTLADGSVAVGLLNTGNFGNKGGNFGDFNISFSAAAVGLECKSRFAVRDLFRHADLGVFTSGFWQEVDESSMLLLRLRCVDSQMQDLVV